MDRQVMFKIFTICIFALIMACNDNWSRINSCNGQRQEVQKDLFGVLYVNGKYIVTGEAENADDEDRASAKSGMILTSPDSLIWTSETSGTRNALFSAAYGDSQIVAVGSNGTILTSQNSNTWIIRISGTVPTLNCITFADNQFVTVGNSGTIFTSTDGISWTIRSSGTTEPLNSVAYGNNQFVAIGYGTAILSSPDGAAWTIRDSSTIPPLYSVSYGDSLFVAVGDRGAILTSPDGGPGQLEVQEQTSLFMASPTAAICSLLSDLGVQSLPLLMEHRGRSGIPEQETPLMRRRIPVHNLSRLETTVPYLPLPMGPTGLLKQHYDQAATIKINPYFRCSTRRMGFFQSAGVV